MRYTLIQTIIHTYIQNYIPGALCLDPRGRARAHITNWRERWERQYLNTRSQQASNNGIIHHGWSAKSQGKYTLLQWSLQLAPNSLRISRLLNIFSWPVSFSTKEINLEFILSVTVHQMIVTVFDWQSEYIVEILHQEPWVPWTQATASSPPTISRRRSVQWYLPQQPSSPPIGQPSLQPARNSTVVVPYHSHSQKPWLPMWWHSEAEPLGKLGLDRVIKVASYNGILSIPSAYSKRMSHEHPTRW